MEHTFYNPFDYGEGNKRKLLTVFDDAYANHCASLGIDVSNDGGEGFETHRQVRLQRLLGIVWTYFPDTPKKIASLHDRKGMVTVRWRRAPQIHEKWVFHRIWEDYLDVYADANEHLNERGGEHPLGSYKEIPEEHSATLSKMVRDLKADCYGLYTGPLLKVLPPTPPKKEAQSTAPLQLSTTVVSDPVKKIATYRGSPRQVEHAYRDEEAERIEGLTEVATEAGLIDIISPHTMEIVEVKKGTEWKHAIGQVLAYSLYYPEYAKRVHLFDVPTERISMIAEQCGRFGIQLSYV